MSHLFRVTLLLMGLAAARPLCAQAWDATKHASGWAFQEADGSFLFFDPATQTLRTWVKGSGLLSSLQVSLPAEKKPSVAAASAAAPVSGGVSDDSVSRPWEKKRPRRRLPRPTPPRRSAGCWTPTTGSGWSAKADWW